jgi:hypothetical protein
MRHGKGWNTLSSVVECINCIILVLGDNPKVSSSKGPPIPKSGFMGWVLGMSCQVNDGFTHLKQKGKGYHELKTYEDHEV